MRAGCKSRAEQSKAAVLTEAREEGKGSLGFSSPQHPWISQALTMVMCWGEHRLSNDFQLTDDDEAESEGRRRRRRGRRRRKQLEFVSFHQLL